MDKHKQEEKRENRERRREERTITRKISEKEGKQNIRTDEKTSAPEFIVNLKEETKEINEPELVERPHIKFLQKYRLYPRLIEEPPLQSKSERKEVITISESGSFSFSVPSVGPVIPLTESREVEITPLHKVHQTKLVVPSTGSEQIEQPRLIPLPLQEKKEIVEKKEVSFEEVPEPTGTGITVEEIPDFLDIMFTSDGGSIDSGEPTLILADESDDQYIEALRTICCRIFREKTRKGIPKAPIFTHLTDDFKKEITKWMKGENQVFTARLGKEDWEKFERQEDNHIQDRLSELPREQYGFIIFNNKIGRIGVVPYVHTLTLKPKITSLEKKIDVFSLVWGYVDIKRNELEGTSFDHIFEKARAKFKEKLQNIDEPYFSIVRRNKETPESDDLHFPLKLFVTKYLTEEIFGRKMKLTEADKIMDKIETESDFGEVTPDILVRSNGEKFANQVFEIETLFGQGRYPLEKIDETIEKYEEEAHVPRVVNIVLDNLTMLRHLQGLYKKLLIHQRLKESNKRKFELKFWALNIEKGTLVSLEKVIKDFTAKS